MELIMKRFPETPILPNIGNNDLIHHYQAPNSSERIMYYGDLFRLWFDKVPANIKYSTPSLMRDIRENFRHGGYYRWDLSQSLSVLSFNSIFGSPRNNEIDIAEQDQLEWLENQLNEERSTKFIIHMHIPPGLWYAGKDEQFWKNDSMDAFLDIITKYQNRIHLLVGAHIHSGEIRAP